MGPPNPKWWMGRSLPNLEVFKFGLYLFVPVFALLHFGDPDWYHNNVLPVRVDLEHISICVEELCVCILVPREIVPTQREN